VKRLLMIGVVAVAFCFIFAGVAKADTIGTLTLSNCGTAGTACPAATYSFDITSTSATLTITINGGLTSANDNLTAVDLGFTTQNNVSSLGAFTTSGNVTGTWTATDGSLSSGGSCGVNNGAFVCASVSPLNGLTLATGKTYTFTWNYTLTDPNGIFASGDVHIGAEYGPNAGNNYNGLIVSQTIPEPSTLTLLGAGLLAMCGFALRRSLTS